MEAGTLSTTIDATPTPNACMSRKILKHPDDCHKMWDPKNSRAPGNRYVILQLRIFIPRHAEDTDF